ncbi:DUF3298 domain-containing protein [Psychroserpens mesophilus]|uniref:DUF3298 domain-containing protein n=1 Tax=Psychroserpens mesophilus TaxID=325473 RepID=UPI00126A39FE|nr:DUF3298 domain-containing protein [Psychroserpens mesophilus]
MKYLYILFLILLLSNCKNDSNKENFDNIEDIEVVALPVKDTSQTNHTNIESLDKSITIEMKQKTLIKKSDEREELQKLILDKRYVIEKEDYNLNFKYPLLNESFKPTHRNFNEFINEYYINVSQIEKDILESKLLCDSIEAQNFREERFIDYKIYNVNDQLVSILFYKENFYSGAMHPSFSFDCFNFDLNRGVFMTYDDFFIEGSEGELLMVLNEKLNEKIKSGGLYYDCWELSLTDFIGSKNNFVLNETYVEFYFDDCTICPSYTGTYSIELQLIDLLSVLKKYDLNPLVF